MAATYRTAQYGDRGDHVRALQNALNSAGYQLSVDGVFGEATRNAVRNYQSANGLDVDGIVGGNTWGALNRPAQAGGNAAGAGSGLTVSGALEQLIAQYNAASTGYEPMTAEEMQTQAENEYASYYDQLELAAQQQQQQSDLALAQQQEGLQSSYDRQREAVAREYARGYAAADRQMLSRGMQRSSYGAQTLAGITTQGAEAQQALGEQQATAEANIGQQRAQLAQQLAGQLQQYSASEAADVQRRIRELEEREYNRRMQATQYAGDLSAQLYQYLYQAQQDQIQQNQWQQEFDASQRRRPSGSSGGGSSNTDDAPTTTPTQTGSMSYGQLLSALGGGSQGAMLGALSGVAAGSTAAHAASAPPLPPRRTGSSTARRTTR